ncbi:MULTISPECIES: flagellar filament capping protein FliD [unclassified Pseudomonas]|uniref:flagellar filament capping protein FliD n=1 Tax=unclassified Pseudomonas TaxID=196821 RepID=UPI0023D8B5C9|nr:flagellar filament capping protein FliD [Pseudomonas sp. PSE14]WEJ70692.1 flagellar filament capping protein FliD [Pseudomonas sp. PSE14]
MGMTITGTGTGLNIDNIVQTMVAAEKAPKQNQLDTLEKATTTKITGIGSLKSALSTFQTALEALNKTANFQARSATSSKNDLIGVTATDKAGIGSYQIEVKQLAAASKVALAAIPANGDKAATFGQGTLSIKLGDTALPDIKIDSSNNTLAGVRDAINTAGKDAGVSATIITDEHGSRLVLSSSKTGAGKDISVAVSGDDGSGSAKLTDLAFTPPAVPTDPTIQDPPAVSDPSGARMLVRSKSAELTVDGLKITSESNTVTDALEGVTLNLKGVTEASTPVTVGVSLDQSGVKKNIQSFVDAYNALVSTINSQTKVTKVGDDKAPVTGALVGDATARAISASLHQELVNVQGDGKIRALADLGITTQTDGTLAIDSTKLDKAVTGNFDEITALFTGDNGLAARLTDRVKPYTITNGILDQRNSSLQATLKSVDKQQVTLDARMTALQERLYKQFNAMDALVSQLTQTTNSLTSQLASLPFAKG